MLYKNFELKTKRVPMGGIINNINQFNNLEFVNECYKTLTYINGYKIIKIPKFTDDKIKDEEMIRVIVSELEKHEETVNEILSDNISEEDELYYVYKLCILQRLGLILSSNIECESKNTTRKFLYKLFDEIRYKFDLKDKAISYLNTFIPRRELEYKDYSSLISILINFTITKIRLFDKEAANNFIAVSTMYQIRYIKNR